MWECSWQMKSVSFSVSTSTTDTTGAFVATGTWSNVACCWRSPKSLASDEGNISAKARASWSSSLSVLHLWQWQNYVWTSTSKRFDIFWKCNIIVQFILQSGRNIVCLSAFHKMKFSTLRLLGISYLINSMDWNKVTNISSVCPNMELQYNLSISIDSLT